MRTYTDGPSRGGAVGSTRTTTPTAPSSTRSEPIPGRGPVGSNRDSIRSQPITTVPRYSSVPRSATPDIRTGPSVGRSTRLRSVGTSGDQARAREQLALRSARSRARTVTRSDILQRYRGTNSSRSREAQDPARGERRSSDSGSAAAARIRAARSSASTNARSEKLASNAQRAQSVRNSRQQARVGEARQSYLEAVNKRRVNQTSGRGLNRGNGSNLGGLGYTGGYNNNYANGFQSSYYAGIGSYYPSIWGGNFSWFWGPSFYYSSYWWHSYWYYGGGLNGYGPNYYYYGPFLPASDTIIYVGDQGSNDVSEVIYVDEEPAIEEQFIEEPLVSVPLAAEPLVTEPEADGLGRAADYYLAIGDRAFREARFGDAVHYYAKAVEHSPEEGVLFLILADALFATGDYHYAAYSLRRALDLDPELASNVVDKHSFYTEPGVFDRQLEVLERYLEDHFLDEDARLVLAANYLFSNRAEDCAELLQNAYSKDVRASPAGQILLDAAISSVTASASPAASATSK